MWEYQLEQSAWVPHPEMEIDQPRSIFACCCSGDDGGGGSIRRGVITVFGGELKAAGGHKEAGAYSCELLSISLGAGGVSAGDCPAVGRVQSVRTSSGAQPAGRGWTSGCLVQYTTEAGKQIKTFAVFGGLRLGLAREPVGVRLNDLFILE